MCRRLNTNSTNTSLINKTYEDKIKKIEEEKVCLPESFRILSTESSACSKVSTECAVNNQQESPEESITLWMEIMKGSTQGNTIEKQSQWNDAKELHQVIKVLPVCKFC